MSEVLDAIRAANDEFSASFAAGDFDRHVACHADGIQAFVAGMDVISGKDGVREFWSGVRASGVAKVTLETRELDELGDTAIEVGQGELFDEKGTRLDQLKYIVVWKRVDGSWKLHRDMFSTNLS